MRPDQNDVLDVDAVPEVSNYSELEGSVKGSEPALSRSIEYF